LPLVPWTGGAGRRRGGLGQDIEFEFTAERPVAGLFMTERTRFAAPGFAGGEAGGIGSVEINGESIDTHKRHMLKASDRVLLRTPGGGGFGDAAAREDDRVALDRKRGYFQD